MSPQKMNSQSEAATWVVRLSISSIPLLRCRDHCQSHAAGCRVVKRGLHEATFVCASSRDKSWLLITGSHTLSKYRTGVHKLEQQRILHWERNRTERKERADLSIQSYSCPLCIFVQTVLWIHRLPQQWPSSVFHTGERNLGGQQTGKTQTTVYQTSSSRS